MNIVSSKSQNMLKQKKYLKKEVCKSRETKEKINLLWIETICIKEDVARQNIAIKYVDGIDVVVQHYSGKWHRLEHPPL